MHCVIEDMNDDVLLVGMNDLKEWGAVLDCLEGTLLIKSTDARLNWGRNAVKAVK